MTESKKAVNTETKKQIRTKGNGNIFKMKCIFKEHGENVESIVEKAFSSYCNKSI